MITRRMIGELAALVLVFVGAFLAAWALPYVVAWVLLFGGLVTPGPATERPHEITHVHL